MREEEKVAASGEVGGEGEISSRRTITSPPTMDQGTTVFILPVSQYSVGKSVAMSICVENSGNWVVTIVNERTLLSSCRDMHVKVSALPFTKNSLLFE